MNFCKKLILIIVLLSNLSVSAQTFTNKFTVLLHKQKMPNNNGIGRLIGRPVPISKFVLDSSMYNVIYVCEVLLTPKNSTDSLKFHYLIGQKKKNELLLTFDMDFDNNFLNDTVKTIDLSSCNNCDFKTISDCIEINLKKIYNLNYKPLTLHVVPPCCFKNLKRHSLYPFLDTLNISLESPYVQTNDFTVNKKKYIISVSNIRPRTSYQDKSNLKVFIKDVSDEKVEDVYNFSDTIKIDKRYYTISQLSVFADSISFKEVFLKKVAGYKTGYYLYDFHEKDIFSQNTINSQDFRGNYLLMEFWGTWCTPCITLHNELIDLLNRHNKLKYLGIAFDNNIDKVKSFIRKSPEINKQIFVDMNSKNTSIVNKFRITNYPTFVLINKEGKIIFNQFGIDGFHQLVKFLN